MRCSVSDIPLRSCSPSVVYINEIEKILCSDSKRKKEFKAQGLKDKADRIKKDLLGAMKDLAK
eukprot:SAG11_NODE_19141_length_473_cov_1.163102_1_plen_62_part_10